MPTSRRPPVLPRSLAGQLFAAQVLLVAVVVAGCVVFAYAADRDQAERAAGNRASATAKAVAASPSVRSAIHGRHPARRLQPYAERVRRDTGVTFVTIMNPRGMRWSHPDPTRIGGRFLGHTGAAARGGTVRETYTGTLGPSVRVVVPVRDGSGSGGGSGGGGHGGRVVGLVGAGIAVQRISDQLWDQVELLLGFAGAALALGGLGTYLASARLRRHTHGMNARELHRMHDYHQAALHAVREGLVMLDGQRRVTLLNDGARELLGLAADGPYGTAERAAPGAGDGDVLGRGVDELGLPPALAGALLASEPRVDEVHLTADRVLVVNTSPVDGGERRGTVVTLRDHTELQALTGELDSVRGFAEALRAQAHEAANRLHTVVSLIELGRTEEAVDFATEELELAQALTDHVVTAVAEPVLAALLLGKAAQAHERGVELSLTPDSQVDDGLLPPELPPRALVTVLGNLIDNAVDAAAATANAADATAEDVADSTAGASTGPGGVAVTVRGKQPVEGGGAGELVLRVADSGPGLPAEAVEAVFERGWSTKPQHGASRGLGLALVRQTVRRHGGTITVIGTEPAGGGAEFTVRLPLPATATGTGTGSATGTGTAPTRSPARTDTAEAAP